MCSSTYETLLFRSAFSLTFFFWFLRAGESTTRNRADASGRAIAISDIALAGPGEGALQVRIRFSKTVQKGRSTTITINRDASSQLCPINALKSFLMFVQSPPAPLFIHMDKSPLTRFQFQSVLTSTLAQAGYPAERFKTHSFKIGAATTAAICEFDSDSIKVLGRWES